jgi:hypothetical protein
MLRRRTGADSSGEIEISRPVSRNSATFGRQWQETGPVPAHTRTLRRPTAGACRRKRVSCFVCHGRSMAIETAKTVPPRPVTTTVSKTAPTCHSMTMMASSPPPCPACRRRSDPGSASAAASRRAFGTRKTTRRHNVASVRSDVIQNQGLLRPHIPANRRDLAAYGLAPRWTLDSDRAIRWGSGAVRFPMTSGSSSATAPGALFSGKRPTDASGQTPDLARRRPRNGSRPALSRPLHRHFAPHRRDLPALACFVSFHFAPPPPIRSFSACPITISTTPSCPFPIVVLCRARSSPSSCRRLTRRPSSLTNADVTAAPCLTPRIRQRFPLPPCLIGKLTIANSHAPSNLLNRQMGGTLLSLLHPAAHTMPNISPACESPCLFFCCLEQGRHPATWRGLVLCDRPAQHLGDEMPSYQCQPRLQP